MAPCILSAVKVLLTKSLRFNAVGLGMMKLSIESHEMRSEVMMLPPVAEKKLQAWIRSRHLICSGNFFLFESVDYSAIDRFTECVEVMGGTLLSVDSVGRIWMGDHRQVLLYRAKASLLTPCHDLKQYWIKYGSFRTRFDQQA